MLRVYGGRMRNAMVVEMTDLYTFQRPVATAFMVEALTIVGRHRFGLLLMSPTIKRLLSRRKLVNLP